MKDYIVVYMVDEAQVGDRFTLWPLHMTLLSWFEAPSLESVQDELEEALGSIRPCDVEIGDREYFGQRKLAVKLVDVTPELQKLHETLLGTVEQNRWALKGRFVGENFRPHVTQQAGRDASGRLHVDKVYIAERLPHGYRELVGKVDLQ